MSNIEKLVDFINEQDPDGSSTPFDRFVSFLSLGVVPLVASQK